MPELSWEQDAPADTATDSQYVRTPGLIDFLSAHASVWELVKPLLSFEFRVESANSNAGKGNPVVSEESEMAKKDEMTGQAEIFFVAAGNWSAMPSKLTSTRSTPTDREVIFRHVLYAPGWAVRNPGGPTRSRLREASPQAYGNTVIFSVVVAGR